MNPAATRAAPAVRDAVEHALTAHGLMSVTVPAGPEATRAAVRDAVAAGARVVAVLGGDGTVAHAAAALADTGVALLPLPGGSTNVFARGIGWPARPRRAVELLAEALAHPPRTVRLGRVEADGRIEIACINAGVGIDAAVVDWVERHPRAKHGLRQLAFAGAAAGLAVRTIARAPAMSLTVGDAPPITVYGLVAAWGRPYAYMGARPLDLLPEAAWDGRLTWVAITRPSLMHAGAVIGGGLMGVGAARVPGTVSGRTEAPVTLTSQHAVPAQFDGEPLGAVRRLTLGPGPRLDVIAPPPHRQVSQDSGMTADK